MKVLYGSQNFGYDTDSSDRDYYEIIYPTWEDIIVNRKASKDKNVEGSGIVIKDIRDYVHELKSGNLNIIQTLFSKEYIEADDLSWFIDNRQRILRANLHRAYLSNKGLADRLSDIELTPARLTFGYALYKSLIRILEEPEFNLYNSETLSYRKWAETLDIDRRQSELKDIQKGIEGFKSYFEPYQDKIDTGIINAMDIELIRLMRENMSKK